MSQVVVTGAGGFIGAEVCRRLLADGHGVRAVVRARPVSVDVVAQAGMTVRAVADLMDHGVDESLFADANAVVHLAARVHRVGEVTAATDDLYLRENTELTRRLAETAARAGVRRFVFMSSVKAIGERSPAGGLRRAAEPRPADAYGRSKLAAERALAEVGARTGLEVVVIRPPLVYGPAVGANFRQLVRVVARGIPLPFAAVANRRSVASVWNVAEFVGRCLGPMPSAYEILHVADDRPVSTPELIRLIAVGLDVPARLFSLPPAVLALMLRMAGRSELVDRLLASLELDTSQSYAVLGWKPRLGVEFGVVRAVREMTQ